MITLNTEATPIFRVHRGRKKRGGLNWEHPEQNSNQIYDKEMNLQYLKLTSNSCSVPGFFNFCSSCSVTGSSSTSYDERSLFRWEKSVIWGQIKQCTKRAYIYTAKPIPYRLCRSKLTAWSIILRNLMVSKALLR